MTTTHATLNWTAGDDWQIDATLLDENEVPFDLSGATVKWALMNAAFQRVMDENDVSISVTDALAGKCSILIPAEQTTLLVGGRYLDVLRIAIGGITSTLAYGTIFVAADPWAAQQAGLMGSAQPFQLHAVA